MNPVLAGELYIFVAYLIRVITKKTRQRLTAHLSLAFFAGGFCDETL